MNLLELKDFHGEMGLAMSLDELVFIQNYFRETEKEIQLKQKLKCWIHTGQTIVDTRPLKLI
nr:hypothetical protein [endosymbiont 'TC1' of Trimyema compressum]